MARKWLCLENIINEPKFSQSRHWKVKEKKNSDEYNTFVVFSPHGHKQPQMTYIYNLFYNVPKYDSDTFDMYL